MGAVRDPSGQGHFGNASDEAMKKTDLLINGLENPSGKLSENCKTCLENKSLTSSWNPAHKIVCKSREQFNFVHREVRETKVTPSVGQERYFVTCFTMIPQLNR